MKKLIFLFAATFGLSANQVNVNQLTEEDMNQILQNPGNFVLEFPAQTQLPLHFFLKGDLVSLEEQELQVKQTFYVKIVGEELLFSTNMEEWKSLLELLTGTASASLGIQEGKPCITCGAEANLR